jgi:hypothetical protein
MKPVQVEKEGLPKPMLMLPGKCPAPNSLAARASITASPGKGLETMIDALPAILERHPEVVYTIAGRTHPDVARREGERYRLMLERRVVDDAHGVGLVEAHAALHAERQRRRPQVARRQSAVPRHDPGRTPLEPPGGR